MMDRSRVVRISDPTPSRIVAAGRSALARSLTDMDDLEPSVSVLERVVRDMTSNGRRFSLRYLTRVCEDLSGAANLSSSMVMN